MNVEYDDIFNKIYKIIKYLIKDRIQQSDLDIFDLYYCYTYLNLYINETINDKFVEISKASGNEVVEKEKSIFDDYDKENGYEDEEENKNIYEVYKNTLNCTIKYAINSLKMSYKECIECNLSEMLDYIVFNIRYDLENKNDDD
ncbi:hypothetical protein [Clostridium sp. ZBS4]|uniref:hypothetical protein n=1 Tax=Clostridium sp. ZBS4 TaxID=2949974 RepID=UPI002079F1CA|nr:hypothetical protein [Clostridium sp. ZBS4]